ncbi:MAG: hypothetical protein WCG55_03355 [bacterium]
MFKITIHQNVWFKLTPAGEEFIADNPQLKLEKCGTPGGYYKLSLFEAMQLFVPAISEDVRILNDAVYFTDPEDVTKKYKDYSRIVDIAPDYLMLAMLSMDPASKRGKLFFSIYPDMLSDVPVKVPKKLIDKLGHDLYYILRESLKSEGVDSMYVTYRVPQNDFDGTEMPDGVGISELRSGKFNVKGEPWTVIGEKKDQPYPHTNPSRTDYIFCALPDMVLEKELVEV